jgi:hypothetical protein
MSTDSSPTLIPADGWWAVYKRFDDPRRHYRVRVVAFGTRHDDDGAEGLRAWMPGDAGWLEPADDRIVHLWHDGDSYCHCGADPGHPAHTDDIYWCETCAGEIAR